MSKVVQWKRGNTSAVSNYVGLDGEVVVNTDNYTLAVHDGITPGGTTIGAVASNIGNLYVIDKTIYSANTSNTRITVSTGNLGFHIDGAALVVGQNDGLVAYSSANSNIAGITTYQKGNGNLSLTINANLYPGLQISPNNNIGIRTAFSSTADISYGGNLEPSSANVYNIGSTFNQVKDLFIANAIALNDSTLTINGNSLVVNGNYYYPPNLNVQKVVANNTTTVTTFANNDLQITATDGTHASTIRMWANTGRMSFNTLSNAFDYNFNGYINGVGYIASANDPYGYSFYDPAMGYTGLRHVPAGSETPEYPSYLAINHGNVNFVKFLANLSTEIYGNLIVSTNDDDHGGYPTAPVQFYDNAASYSQIVHQNLSSDPEASTDLVLTADNGTDTEFFVDLGINSSTFYYPGLDAYMPNDGYLLVNGGNLLFNTDTVGKTIKFLIDGSEPQHIVAEFGPTVFTVNNIQTANVTATGYVKTVVDTVGNLIAASEVGIGARAFVTDANTITFASEVSGGGSNAVPVFSNGTVWCVG